MEVGVAAGWVAWEEERVRAEATVAGARGFCVAGTQQDTTCRPCTSSGGNASAGTYVIRSRASLSAGAACLPEKLGAARRHRRAQEV